MKKKGNKKMPTPRQKVIHNPIPTSLFFLKLAFLYMQSKQNTKSRIHSDNPNAYIKWVKVLKKTKM